MIAPSEGDPPAASDDSEAPELGGRASARRAAEGSAGFQAHVRAAKSEFEQQFDKAKADLEQQFDKAKADFEHVNERINERTGRNLLMATAIGLAIGAVVLGSLLFFKGAFVVFALAACLLGVFEFSRALQTAGRRIDLPAQLAVTAVLIVTGYFTSFATHLVIAVVAVAFVCVWRMIAQMVARDGRRYGDVVTDILVSGFLPLYVAFLGSLLMVLLRADGGEYWVLAMIAVVVASDTGAYASGLAFGRHPMAPRISPKKTWEGFAGGALAAIIVAVGFALFLLHIPLWAGIILGVVIFGLATVGDLGESMIKRDLGVKDMSSWLPGHGGVLDRLDSMLPSAVGALCLFLLFSPLAAA